MSELVLYLWVRAMVLNTTFNTLFILSLHKLVSTNNSNLTKKNVYISKQAVISYLNICGFIVEKIIHILFINVRE
jgi:uncharacterized membrane protein